MINKLYTLHLRSKKALSSFLTISEDLLENFFSFLAQHVRCIFLIVLCKNKENSLPNVLVIIILLYL